MKFREMADLDGMANAEHIPLYAYLELTFKCNLRCVHCFADTPHSGKELSFKEVISVIDQLAEAGALYLDLSGGEPFIRKDFFDIATYARKRGFALRISTNATLITEELADKIADLFPLLVKPSLYGASEKIYKKITGRGELFHNAIKGIRLLYERKVPMRVNCQIFNFFTPDDVLGMKNMCEDIGLKWFPCVCFVVRNNGDPGPFKYRLSEPQFEELYRKLPEACDILTESFREHKMEQKICKNLWTQIYINPYGEVGNCSPLVSKWSIRKKPLIEIWKNDPLLKAQREVKWGDLSRCRDCKSLIYCRPCTGRNFMSTGSLTNIPAGFCDYFHMVGKLRNKLNSPVDNKKKKSFTCADNI